MRNRLSRALALALIGVAAGAPPAAAEAPPAPDMPEGWSVTSDRSIPAAEIAPVARRLGGEIAALRNTVYEVRGKRVQLNLIVAVDEGSADAIEASLHALKAEEFVLRHGTTLYELVGADAAIPEMREARAHLERRLPSGDPAPPSVARP